MLLNKEKFTFTSNALDKDTFYVVSFKGQEGLSQLYRFDITLVSDKSDIDLQSVLKNRARFTVKREDGSDIRFNGVLASFEQLHHVDEYTFYRAVLVPKLWYLTLTFHNQIFLNKNPVECIKSALKDGGLTANDYEFKLQGQYENREYVCQFNETHFNFISRWCEREGIYYFFDQTGDTEKVIFTDTKISHTNHPAGDTFYYSPPSGLDHAKREEVMQSLVCKYNSIPQRVLLKDYNFMKPSLEVTGSALVDRDGIGEVYYYGEYFRTPDEGNRLARIRAEQILCTKEEFLGDSTIPYISPGYTFNLQNHYRNSFNQQYLTVEVSHEGSQGGYLISGISENLSEQERKVFYQNSFKAIPAGVQFRAEKKTPSPRISGTISARVDGEGSGKYAELDEYGRYKVKLPFDISGRQDGKASTWIRMATPYAGSNHGMHFPLHKGTEVLITFIEGNPDRPIIASAVPNPENPSQVVDKDQTMNKITTAGGNKIHMEDQEGKQRILLQSPTAKTYVRLGSPNDPDNEGSHEGSGEEHEKEDLAGIKLFTMKGLSIEAGTLNKVILGEETVAVLGMQNEIVIGDKNDVTIGLETGICLAGEFHYAPFDNEIKEIKNTINENTIAIEAQREQISESITKISGEVTELKGEVTKLTGEATELKGEVTKLSGEVTELKGEVTELKGEVTKLTGEATELKGEVTKLSGEVTKLTGEATELKGEVTQLQGAQTKLSGEVTKLSGETTSLAGSIGQIAGLISSI